ncbi:hypothetical protein, partial [Acinetobacter baumannii]|uniref:hypothetical protein n=1 Tax=Acinetobacter baumannii TaxID=470 RepID=UPI003397904E
MSKPTKFMQTNQLFNAHCATEDAFPHGLIADALSPPNSGDATKTSVVKHLEVCVGVAVSAWIVIRVTRVPFPLPP